MSHPWQSLVVGGVGQPRFLKCGPELCLNSGFEVNTIGWETTDGASIVRGIDPLTLWGNYSGKAMAHGDIEQYVSYVHAVSGILANKKFIVTLWIRGELSTKATIAIRRHSGHEGIMPVGERSPLVIVRSLSSSEWTFVVLEGLYPDIAEQYLELAIWPFDTTDETLDPGELYTVNVDEVMIREFTEARLLATTALEMDFEFEKIVKATNTGLDGTESESILGYRHKCGMSYSYLTAEDEAIRRTVARYSNMVFYPHNDFDWCFLAKLDDNALKSGYAPNNFFLGHSGEITVRSVKVFPNIPVGIMSEGEVIGGGESSDGGFGSDISIGE
jgi:hypothetical protein